jgi:kinetochore protein NDC80
MNTEHDQLAQSIDELRAKKAETQKDVHSLEVAVANHGAATEEAVDMYTTLLSGLGLFPPLPQPFQDIDLRMVLNTAASQPDNLLKGLDIRHVIRPTLNDLLEAKRDERRAVNNKRIQMDHEFDELISECEKLEDEINETEKTVMVLDEQAEDLREVRSFASFARFASSHPRHFIAVIDCTAGSPRQQRRDQTIRTESYTGSDSGTLRWCWCGVSVADPTDRVRTKLRTAFRWPKFLPIRYREQMQKITRLQEETVRDIVKNSTEMAVFKETTSQQLKDLRDFATRTYRERVSTMTK